MTGRLVALVLVAASALGAVVACITGSGPGNPVTCTTNADQSCSCVGDSKGDSGTLCPASNAPSDLQCCADFGYPSSGVPSSDSCHCNHVPIGCAFDPFGSCTCGVVAEDASTTPSCTLPTTWTTCCKSSLTCACSMGPDGCGDAGVVVPSCSSTDVGGGTCTMSANSCVCDSAGKGGTTSCGAPSWVCCLNPASSLTYTSCTCGIGTQCNAGGAQQVSSCTTASVADAARPDTCGFYGRAVTTCNPPPDGSFL